MCLLALLYHIANDSALIVGANREEYYHRSGDPPRRLDGVNAVGGVDPAHGGTWLGVNDNGLLVAVTNRRKSQTPAALRSRGLLVRDLLACPSAAAAAAECVRQLGSGLYAGCNFLCADACDAVVIHHGDWLRVRPLPPGIHILSNRDVNDPTDRRAVYAADFLSRQRLATTAEAVPALQRLCASQEPAAAPMCFHLAERGTVCSSLIALRGDQGDSIYRHAPGPPDRTPYEDVSDLLRRLKRPPTKG